MTHEFENKHPGNIIRGRMKLYNLTQRKLAEAMDMYQSDLCKIINGQMNVTPRIAVKLSGALDESPYFWANLQMKHDVEKAILEAGK